MNELKLSEALDQIEQIHGHMARTEIYLGYRPLPVALSGALGLLAAALQSHFVQAGQSRAFVFYWLGVAGISALVAASAVALHFFRQSPFERRQTLYVWGQFMPCIMVGALVGGGVAASFPSAVGILPGLWSLVFSLGIFSSRPFLPRATGWVGLFYLIAGGWMLMNPSSPAEPAWPLAWSFFIGQCAGAIILYMNLERKNMPYGETNRD